MPYHLSLNHFIPFQVYWERNNTPCQSSSLLTHSLGLQSFYLLLNLCDISIKSVNE